MGMVGIEMTSFIVGAAGLAIGLALSGTFKFCRQGHYFNKTPLN
jgi:small-conductance mechanosensitive channel